MRQLIEDLRWRGMFDNGSAGLEEAFTESPVVAYIGFDPTASSLHIGSLVPILTLARLQRAGHKPIAVVGGGTGMIGDPSGKSAERNLLKAEDVERNIAGLRRQLAHFIDFDRGDHQAVLLNNLDWLGPVTLIDFLRDVGKHFTVNNMLAKESVKRRVEGHGGISYTEFTYSVLQAYDFLHLFDHHGCRLQIGGSDQWGNIVSGIELIRRTRGQHAHGFTFPLVTTRTGTKFGKTEGGTVWLDAERTSPYQFYQFWLNTDDQDVGRYLRYFTFLAHDQVEALTLSSRTEPALRHGHRALAEEVTRMTHGETGLDHARRLSEALFGGDLSQLGASDLEDVLSDAPTANLERARLEEDGTPLVDLLVHSGIASSKADAKRTLAGGGVYLNDGRIEDLGRRVTLADAIDQRVIVLRKGRKNYFVLRVVAPYS